MSSGQREQNAYARVQLYSYSIGLVVCGLVLAGYVVVRSRDYAFLLTTGAWVTLLALLWGLWMWSRLRKAINDAQPIGEYILIQSPHQTARRAGVRTAIFCMPAVAVVMLLHEADVLSSEAVGMIAATFLAMGVVCLAEALWLRRWEMLHEAIILQDIQHRGWNFKTTPSPRPRRVLDLHAKL